MVAVQMSRIFIAIIFHNEATACLQPSRFDNGTWNGGSCVDDVVAIVGYYR
jgi:hypothetical protein